MKKISVACFSLIVAGAALAQPYNNWVSSDGKPVKNGTGEHCWRNSSWTAETAHPDCDGAKRTPAPVAAAPAAAAAPAVEPVKPVEQAPAAPAKVSFAAETFFDFDRANLKDQGKGQLDDLMGKLNMLNWSTLTVVGHTDATGSEAYNHDLSVRRANAVKAYFLSKGLPYEKVQAKGMGESQPIADNSTSAGRAKNRRVEVEVVGTAK